MPTQETVYEKCWIWCKKGWFRYPCRKTRTTTEWCYQFDKGRIQHWLFYCRYRACEGSKLYWWSGGCLGFGSGWFYNKRVCFRNKIEEIGSCDDL
jgi:hypothetical protein